MSVPDSSGAVVGKPAVPEAPNPDVLAALIRAGHDESLTRKDVIRLLMAAISEHRLHAADAMKALQDWDKNHAPQSIPARFDERYDPSPEPRQRRIL